MLQVIVTVKTCFIHSSPVDILGIPQNLWHTDLLNLSLSNC